MEEGLKFESFSVFCGVARSQNVVWILVTYCPLFLFFFFFPLKLPPRDCLDCHYTCFSKSIHILVIPTKTEPAAAPGEDLPWTAGEDVPKPRSGILWQSQEQQVAVQKEPVGLQGITGFSMRKKQRCLSKQNPFLSVLPFDIEHSVHIIWALCKSNAVS